MKTAILLIAAVIGNFQGQTVSYSPKPAPRIYVSHKFGLMMKVPAGLSFCDLPKEWSGSEEGTVLFLKPPSGCIAVETNRSTTRPVSGFTPSITVYYRRNASKYDPFDGEIRPTHTSEEFAGQFCPDFVVSPDLKLFDHPALTCRYEMNSGRVRIVLMALYGSANNDSANDGSTKHDSANNILMLSLLTTKDRLASDRQVLGKISSALTACKFPSGKEKTKTPACPHAMVW
jgi:hypothetical protein